ncbi:MAG: glycosyltransferase family 2 protein [Candidatus Lokiarchaeia archaeon]
MPNYRFSILIPSWNDEKYITKCIDSLLSNKYENFKIILIAGGTGKDNSYKCALELQKKYPDKVVAIEQKKGTKNKALNQGLKEVDGDIIVLTDIDCIYQVNWLTRINEIFQNRKINVITSYALPFPNQKSSLAEYNNIKYGYNLVSCCEQGKIIKSTKLCGANSMFRKEIFLKKIGKFDENIPTGDDKILGMTFNKKGEDIYYFNDIYIFSECYSNSMKNYIKHRIRWARDLFIILNKKNILKILMSFGIAIFKLLYPIGILIYWLFFSKLELLFLFLLLLPWFAFFILYLTFFYFQLKKLSIEIKVKLDTTFNFKKAFKIVPILFFAYSIITIVSVVYPKRSNW